MASFQRIQAHGTGVRDGGGHHASRAQRLHGYERSRGTVYVFLRILVLEDKPRLPQWRRLRERCRRSLNLPTRMRRDSLTLASFVDAIHIRVSP